MQDKLKVSFDQIVPFSKARANLSSLIDTLKKEEYVVITKKYQPKAALVRLEFLEKMFLAWERWKRAEAFRVVDEIRALNEDKDPEKVERDVQKAIDDFRQKQKKVL